MYRVIAALLTIIMVLAGCSVNDSTANSPNSLTTCKKEPYKSYLNESEITKTDTLFIHHKDGYVTKTVFVEESVLKDGGDIEDLKYYEQMMELTFSQELYPTGFTYSIKQTGPSLILTTTYDYTQMNIKEELEKGKLIFHVNDLVDENFRIPYNEVIKAYTKNGFVCECE